SESATIPTTPAPAISAADPGAAPLGSECLGQQGDHHSARRATERAQNGDTPGRTPGDLPAARDEPWSEGGEGADLRRPGVGGGGGERAGRDWPRAEQRRDGGDAPV